MTIGQGVDLCEPHGRTLLVVCDYYSNFIEVEKINKANTMGNSKVLFSRHGVPEEVVSDNGLQFSSAELEHLHEMAHHIVNSLSPDK